MPIGMTDNLGLDRLGGGRLGLDRLTDRGLGLGVSRIRVSHSLKMYNANPRLFSEDEIDILEKHAKRFDMPFQRNMVVSGANIGGTLNQLVSGVVQGFTTLGWADDPRTTGEALAGRIGHLIGFAPDVILGVLALLEPTLLGEAAFGTYLSAKYGTKVAFKKGMEAGGKLVAGQTAKQLAAKKGLEKIIGRELKESPFRLKSIPFRGAEWIMKRGTELGKQAGWDATKFLTKHPTIGGITEEALRLGLASGVSAWREGPEGIAQSTAHGAMAGAIFGSAANMVRIDKLLRKSPIDVSRGEKALETVAKMSIGAGFMGGMSTVADEPMPVQVYEYLMGAFFGGGAKPTWQKLASAHFTKMNKSSKAVDTFDPTGIPGYDILPKESKDWLNMMTKKHMGQLFEYHTSEKGQDTPKKKIASTAFLSLVAMGTEKGIFDVTKTDAESQAALDIMKRLQEQRDITTELERTDEKTPIKENKVSDEGGFVQAERVHTKKEQSVIDEVKNSILALRGKDGTVPDKNRKEFIELVNLRNKLEGTTGRWETPDEIVARLTATPVENIIAALENPGTAGPTVSQNYLYDALINKGYSHKEAKYITIRSQDEGRGNARDVANALREAELRKQSSKRHEEETVDINIAYSDVPKYRVVDGKKTKDIVPAYVDRSGDVPIIVLNRKEMKKKFKKKAWTDPKVKGVKPLPEDTFKTYEEFEAFTLGHEKGHVENPYDAKVHGTRAEYENIMNNLGMKEMLDYRHRNGEQLGFDFQTEITTPVLIAEPELAKQIITKLKKDFPWVTATEVEKLYDQFGDEVVGKSIGTAVEWSRTEAGVETPPHEYAEVYLNMFLGSEIVKKGIAEFGSRHKLATMLGLDYVEKITDRSFKGRAKRWVRKFWLEIKKFFGKLSDNRENYELLSARFFGGKKSGRLKPQTRGFNEFAFQRFESVPEEVRSGIIKTTLKSFDILGDNETLRVDENLFGRLMKRGVKKGELDLLKHIAEKEQLGRIKGKDLKFLTMQYLFPIKIEKAMSKGWDDTMYESRAYHELTVPGGEEYGIYKLELPFEVIKAHPSFADHQMLGWFRGDIVEPSKKMWVEYNKKKEGVLFPTPPPTPPPDKFEYRSDDGKDIFIVERDSYDAEGDSMWTVRKIGKTTDDTSAEYWEEPTFIYNNEVEQIWSKKQGLKPRTNSFRVLEIQSDLLQGGRKTGKFLKEEKTLFGDEEAFHNKDDFYVIPGDKENISVDMHNEDMYGRGPTKYRAEYRFEKEEILYPEGEEYIDHEMVTREVDIYRLEHMQEGKEYVKDFIPGETKLPDGMEKYAVMQALKEKQRPKSVGAKQVFLEGLTKNWHEYFVRSIIQWASEKGYDDVRFPLGETAAKIEGKTLIKDHIKTLKKDVKHIQVENINNENVNAQYRKQKIKLEKRIDQYQKEITSRFKKIRPAEITNEKLHELMDPLDAMQDAKNKLSRRLDGKNANIEAIDKQIVRNNKRITDNERDIHRYQTEALEKLAPIEAFYGNQIRKFLLKERKLNIKKLTDDNGNDWLSTDLTPSDKMPIIQYQRLEAPPEPKQEKQSFRQKEEYRELDVSEETESVKPLDKQHPRLYKKIVKMLKEMYPEIKGEALDRVFSQHGEEVAGRAINDLAQWSLKKGKITDPPHEYSHIYINLLEGTSLVRGILDYIMKERSVDLRGAKEILAQQMGEGFVKMAKKGKPTIFAKKLSNAAKQIWSTLRRLFRKKKKEFTEVNEAAQHAKQLNKLIYNFFSGENRDAIRFKPKKGFVKVDIEKALKSTPFAKSIIDKILTDLNNGLVLTGSGALSVQGEVYRLNNNLLHDIDIVSLHGLQEGIDILLTAYPNSKELYNFKTKNGSKIATFIVPEDGTRIIELDKFLGTRLESYKVQDIETGKIVGTYKADISKKLGTNMTQINSEHKEGKAGLLVDIMESVSTEKTIKYHSKLLGKDILMKDAESIFTAKWNILPGMKLRDKDILDWGTFYGDEVDSTEYLSKISKDKVSIKKEIEKIEKEIKKKKGKLSIKGATTGQILHLEEQLATLRKEVEGKVEPEVKKTEAEIDIEQEIFSGGTDKESDKVDSSEGGGGDVIIRYSVLDDLIRHIQDVDEESAPYIFSKKALQDDLTKIKQETLDEGGGVEEFLEKLSNYAPNAGRPRDFNANVRKFFKRIENNVNRPQFTWNRNDGFVLATDRNPATEADKFFGKNTQMTISKVVEKHNYVHDKTGQERVFEIEVSPFDMKRAYRNKNGDWIKEKPYLSKKDWRLMESQLEKDGYYIFGGANNRGVLIARRMHPGVYKEGIEPKSKVEIMAEWDVWASSEQWSPEAGRSINRKEKFGENFDITRSRIEFAAHKGYVYDEMAGEFKSTGNQFKISDFLDELRTVDKNFDDVYDRAQLEELARLGLPVGKIISVLPGAKKKSELREAALKHLEHKVVSNVLYLMGENQSNLTRAMDLFKHVIDFNKRQSLAQGTEYPLKPEDVVEHLDADGKLSYIIVNELPEFEADTDGGIQTHSKLMDSILRAFGMEKDSGFIKSVGYIHSGVDGLEVDKPGMHIASKRLVAFMDELGVTQIKYGTAVKVGGGGTEKGQREATEIRFNEKTDKWELVGEAKIYKMNPEQLKINVNVTDSKRKNTGPRNLFKPAFAKMIKEQMPDIDGVSPLQTMVDEIFRPAVEGKTVSNEKVSKWLDGTEEYKAGNIGRKGINLDDIGTAEIFDIIQSDPTSEMTKDILKFIFKKVELESREEGEIGEQMEIDNAQSLTIKGVLEEGNYDFTVWMDPKIMPAVLKSLGNYIINRAFKPKWRDSTYMRIIDNTEEYRKRYNLQPGEFMLQSNQKDRMITFLGSRMTKGEAYLQYQEALKDPKTNKETLQNMIDDLSEFGGRVPVSGASGIRNLRVFKGFLDERGYGILLNKKDKYMFGGADDDADAVHTYGQFNKVIRKAFEGVENELLDENGQPRDLKNPALFKKYFGIDETSRLHELYTSPSSVLMPSMRLRVAQGSYEGNKSVGIVTNASQLMQVLMSTVIEKGGEHRITKDLGKGRTATIILKYNSDPIPEVPGFKEKNKGDMFRYFVFNAQNNTLDADLPMNSAKQIRQMLFDRAFKSEYWIEEVDPISKKVVKHERMKKKKKTGVLWNDLYGTDFGTLMELNNKIFGYNFQNHRAWLLEDILGAITNASNNASGYVGFFPMAAKVFGNYGFNLDMSNVVNVSKLRKALQAQNKKGDFAPGSEFLKFAGRENLPISGAANYADTTLLLNDFHDYIITKKLIVPLGKKIHKALTEQGVHPDDIWGILSELATQATDFKTEGTARRGKARTTSESQADMRVKLDREIDNYRQHLIDTAEGMGINKDLLVRYFDAYILGPLKYQNPERYADYRKELTTIINKMDKLTSETDYDKIELDNLQKEKKLLIKEFNQTSRQSVGWNSQVIPTEVKAKYRKIVGDALKEYYIDKYKVEVDESILKPQTRGNEPEPTIETEDALLSGQELMQDNLDVDFDAVYKLRNKLDITDKQAALIDEFTDYLKKYPQFANEISKIIPGMIGEMEIIGRKMEHMTWDDVSMFLRMFRQMDKMKKEDLPVKWKHHYLFYSRLDEIMTPNDMQLIESADVRPVFNADGTIEMHKTKLPMSMFGIIRDGAAEAYSHDNSFVKLWLEKKDKMFSYLTTVDDADIIVDWAMRSMEKNGDNRNYSDIWTQVESLKIYKGRWAEVEKEFQALQSKGKIHQIRNESGKLVRIDTFDLMKKIQVSVKSFFQEFGDFLIYKPYEEADILDKNGELRVDFVKRVLSSIIGQVPFEKVQIEGHAAINRLMYELDIQDMVKAEKLKRRGRFSKRDRLIFINKYRKENPPPTESTGTGATGRIGAGYYWHHTGFNETKYNRKINEKSMTEFLKGYSVAVMKGKVPVPDYLQVRIDRKEITHKQAMEHMIYLKRQGYDRMKMGSLSDDLLLGERTVEWLMTKTLSQEEAHKTRMKSQASASFSRGDVPLPGYRTDLKVLDDYVKSWSRSYFNNLIAIRARIGIDHFVERGLMGPTRGGHALGPQQTRDWSNMMLEMTKRIIGYPTFFSEAVYGITPKKGRTIKRYLDGQKLSQSQQEVIDEMKEGFMNERKAEFGPKAFDKTPPEQLEANDRMRMKAMLKSEVNRLGAYRTGYYLYSDEVAVKFLDKMSTKLLGGKMPFYGELPKDPKTRKQVLSRMVHKFGVLEGKYSLISLLSHFKTSIGNIMGGSENIISNTGLRHYKNALSTKYLLDNVFKGATFQKPSAHPWKRGADGKRIIIFETVEIKTKEDIGDWLESIGVIDNYMKTEIGLDPTWQPGQSKKFIEAVVRKVGGMRRRNPNITDEDVRLTVTELGKRHGVIDALVDKGAAFMQRSEIWLRRNAFIAHYLNAYEALRPVSEELPWNSPVLIHFGKKGVEATQFMYHAAFRTNYSNTALGKVMTRFQPFAWNSLKFRRHVYQTAKLYGFKQGTKAFQRHQRTQTMDMMALGLGVMFMGSIFDYAMAPPMSWMVDTSQWLFGDERARERAFFSQWPTTAMAPLQPITAPITRFPLNVLATLIDGNFDKFASFYIHTWYPFGRLARDVGRTLYNPSMIVENMTGLPLHRFQRKSTKYWKDSFGIEDE